MDKTSTEIREFVLKSYEKLDQLEQRLSAVQSGSDALKHWSDACPAFYDFAERGSSLGFLAVQNQAQAVENMLKRLDRAQILPQPHVIGYLFNLANDLRQHLGHIQAYGVELSPGGFKPATASPSPVVQNLVPLNPISWLQKTLVFRTPDDGRMAMPFDNVMRLEAFEETTVEQEGDRDGIRYRDRWMPLVDVSRILPERRIVFRRPPVKTAPGQTRQMIVYVTPYGEVGLVVDEIMDIFKAKVEVQRPASRAGVHGSMELQNRTTEILDIAAILSKSGLVFSSNEAGVYSSEQMAG